jgi:hypothetical protein
VQRPNVPLLVWLAASIPGWLTHLHDPWSMALRVTAMIALVVWAGDEIARGTTPFRRLLGTAVLGLLIARWVVS